MILYNIHILLVKAIIVSFLCLELTDLIHLPDRLSPIFCGLICISPDILGNFKRGLQQLFGAILGVVIGYAFAKVFGVVALSTACAIGLTFFVCYYLGWAAILTGAFFTVLYMHILPIGDSLEHTFLVRLQAVTLGIGVATLVNYAFSFLRHHKIYSARFKRCVSILIIYMVPMIEACKRKDRKEVRKDLSYLRSLSFQVRELSMEIGSYSTMGRKKSKIFGVKKDDIFSMKLFISAWSSLLGQVIELGSLYNDKTSEEIFSQEGNSLLRDEINGCLNSISIQISRASIPNTELEAPDINFDEFQKKLLAKDLDSVSQSMFIRVTFLLRGMVRNIETIYEQRTCLD
ncbi:MAG: FUSC family protein [Candidatus Cloacimonetes bacterium]|nr:FUSC family protein [Candidatus Cloacimonadota bacterium]